ncbi:MAG: response regulator [Alphaproteobacteria bacterium]|nr:response regulator [Alphaproteobacteria bacterium]
MAERERDATVTDRLLIVDDQPQFGDIIAKVGRSVGFDVKATERANEFRRLLDSFQPTVVTIDLVMPETDGIALLRELAAHRCKASILVTSGLDVRTLSWAETLGRELGLKLAGVIPKPVRVAERRTLLEGLKSPQSSTTGTAN